MLSMAALPLDSSQAQPDQVFFLRDISTPVGRINPGSKSGQWVNLTSAATCRHQWFQLQTRYSQMLAYIFQLRKQSNAALAQRTAAPSAKAKEYTPVHVQLERLFAAMPEKQRNRDWTVAELIPRLQGEFRARPSTAGVAVGLKRLGFLQFRDYTRAAGGVRFWRAPK